MTEAERLSAKAAAFKAHIESDDAEHASIYGGRRCGLETSTFRGWFSGYSPRNGSFASVEGDWNDWVSLARQIIAIDEAMKGSGSQLADANTNKDKAT